MMSCIFLQNTTPPGIDSQPLAVLCIESIPDAGQLPKQHHRKMRAEHPLADGCMPYALFLHHFLRLTISLGTGFWCLPHSQKLTSAA